MHLSLGLINNLLNCKQDINVEETLFSQFFVAVVVGYSFSLSQ